MQILYSYFRYTGRLFLGYALFVARCNTIRTSWETKKERLSCRTKCIKEFVWGISLFWLHALLFVFLLLSSSCRMATIKMHILLWVVFCVMISWVNGQKYKLYNLIPYAFFISNAFFFKLTLSVAWLFHELSFKCCLGFAWYM